MQYLSIALWLFLSVVFLIAAYAARIGAPTVATRRARIKDILEIANLQAGDVVYDLGSGCGDMVRAFAAIDGVRVVGFELSPLAYAASHISLASCRIKNARILFKNFFCAPLGDADIVYCFLMPHSMQKLKEKFARELKPGTRVISFAFKIDGWEPKYVLRGNNLPPVFFYASK